MRKPTKGWFLLKILRCDTNKVGEDEVTVTSGHWHKQKEQGNKAEKRGLHPVGRVMLLNHGGARLVTLKMGIHSRHIAHVVN